MMFGGETDDDDGCADGGAAEASTMMSVILVRQAAGGAARRLEASRLVLWVCAWLWWPLCRWARRQAAGSTARAVLAWGERRAPWAFRAALRPERWGGWDGEVARGFGGSRGLWYACDGQPRRVTGLAPVDLLDEVRPTPRRLARKDRDGRVIGWRMVAR